MHFCTNFVSFCVFQIIIHGLEGHYLISTQNDPFSPIYDMYKSPYSPVSTTGPPIAWYYKSSRLDSKFVGHLNPVIWWKSTFDLTRIRIYACKSTFDLMKIRIYPCKPFSQRPRKPISDYQNLSSPTVRVYRFFPSSFFPFPNSWAPF